MTMRRTVLAAVAAVLLAMLGSGSAAAQTNPVDRRPDAAAAPADPEAARTDEPPGETRFRESLTGARLVGRFTIDPAAGGDPPPAREEEYAITSVAKLGNGDWWTVLARIRYGSVDLTLPVPVRVKWAGDTPVITLDKATLPGLGTFSCRVVLDGERYAGTWQHDSVGGHMIGRILRDTAKDPSSPAPDSAPAGSPSP